jgi:hypothetical protein
LKAEGFPSAFFMDDRFAIATAAAANPWSWSANPMALKAGHIASSKKAERREGVVLEIAE